MTKRARYSGPHPAVEVALPSGHIVTVEHGHLLPAKDPDGNPVPAGFRDRLLEQADNWTETEQASGKTKTKTTASAEKKGDDR